MNPTTPKSDERNGRRFDKWGACVCCDGEIPHGHFDNCDIYKMELELRASKSQNERLVRALEWAVYRGIFGNRWTTADWEMWKESKAALAEVKPTRGKTIQEHYE